MRFNKRYFLYGTLMGVLLLILQVVKYKMLIREMELEIFALILSVIFISLGIWLAYIFIEKKRGKVYIKTNSGSKTLSKRELDVLLLLADGQSNQEIADKLFVSLNTTKTHIANIYLKLNVKRRTQAVQKALELGLIVGSDGSES